MKIKNIILSAVLMTSSLLAAAENESTLTTIKEYSPIALANGAINDYCPEGAKDALKLLLNLGISQVPGGKILRFYAATEKDLERGNGSIARLFGEGVKGLVKKAPGGGYIVELANDIKPNGYASLTEAVIANFVPGGKITIDQGFNECVKTAIANVPGIGAPIKMAYKFLANYSYEKHGNYKATAENLFKTYEELLAELTEAKREAEQYTYIGDNYENTDDIISEGINRFIRGLFTTYDEEELLKITKEMRILRNNDLLGKSFCKGWFPGGIATLKTLYPSKYEPLLDYLTPLFPNEEFD